jgi:copper resistance protein B
MTRLVPFLAGAAALAFTVPASAQDHSAHDMQPAGPSSCSPEHARMGHCTLTATQSDRADATGTDLPPGDAPAPPPPHDWYADRIYPKAEMDRARHGMVHAHGEQAIAFLNFDLAEYQARKGGDGFRWDVEGWYGGDIDRLTFKSEGEGILVEGVEHAELQFLYSRAIGPYFNLQAGIRQDLGEGPDRTYAVAGFEGLAPYWFEVEGALFLSNKGDFLGLLGGYYDQRITQRLILQPRTELNFAFQDVPEARVGAGLSDVELGLRLRYEIVKEFAPYVGVEWARKLGDTARFTRAAGEDADSVSFVMGARVWF